MAQITEQVGSFASGLVIAQIVWNNANGSISKGIVINNSPSRAVMRVELNPPINNYSSVELAAPANQTTEQNFPNNTVKKTQVTEDGVQGWSLIGVNIFCQWPSPLPA